MTVQPRHHDTHAPDAGTAMPSLLDPSPAESHDPSLRMLASLPAGGQAEWSALLARRSASSRRTRVAWAAGVVMVGAVAVALVSSGRVTLDRSPAGSSASPLDTRTASPLAAAGANKSPDADLPSQVASAAPVPNDRPATDPWQALTGLHTPAAGPMAPLVTEQRGALTESARIETAADPIAALTRTEPVVTRSTAQAPAGRTPVAPAAASRSAAKSHAAARPDQRPATSKSKSPPKSKPKTTPGGTSKLASKRPVSPAAKPGGKPTAPARTDPDVDLIAALIGHMDTTERAPRHTGAASGRTDTTPPRAPAKAGESTRSR